MKKILIAGSRSLRNNKVAIETLDAFFNKYSKEEVEIITGMANGIDMMAYEKAKAGNYTIHEYPADWEKYGKSAGYIRNAEMVKLCTAALVLWDGKSKGTKHTIDLCEKQDKLAHIITIY